MKYFHIANNKLPQTPAEVLDISTPEREQEIEAAVKAAENSGEWEYPYKEAATDLKEMTLTDIFYWVYKSQNPITTSEANAGFKNAIHADKTIIKLPDNFKKLTSLTIGAGGDLLQADGLGSSKDILFENVADLLFEQDISYANFESPVTHQPLVKELIGDKGAPIECCSHDQFETLTSHKGKRFTIMNTANNHMFDMGLEGLATTLDAFEEAGIIDIGTNRSREDFDQCKVLTVNGIKLGLVSSTFGLNGHQMPPSEAYRIQTSELLPRDTAPDLTSLKKQIDDSKSQNCDFVLATMHWGFEFEMFPRNRQVEAAHDLVEYGADAIISHHPHVIQPIEYYETKRDPDRVATIAYSLGSLTWGYTAPHIVLSLIQNFTLTKGKIGEKEATYIEQTEATPVFRSAIESEGKIITQIEKLSDHVDGKNNRHTKEYISEIERFAQIVLNPPTAL